MHKPRNWGLFALALLLCFSSFATSATGGMDTVVAPASIDTLWSQARDQALGRVINPNDYDCEPTAFDAWIGAKFAAVEDFGKLIEIAQLYGAFNWATYYSLLFDNDASDDYMGIDGGQTKEFIKRHKDNMRFWDVPTDDILIQGMHGIDMADDAKMVPVVQFFRDYGFIPLSPLTTQEIVDYVQSVIEGDAGLGYDNPLWSLNAFAASSRGEPEGSPFASIPDKIVMGDGISEMLADLGLGDSGPDFVHAHEFAHHVQYELGVLDGYGGTPEETRRIELMSDAFGSYYCAHARGATFQAKRIVEAFRASYLVGDCGFKNPGHHGTPNQREAASMWGADLAASAKKQGHIKSAASMLVLFEAVLPDLVAPDAK